MEEGVYVWMDGCLDEWVEVCMNLWMDGLMGSFVNCSFEQTRNEWILVKS